MEETFKSIPLVGPRYDYSNTYFKTSSLEKQEENKFRVYQEQIKYKFPDVQDIEIPDQTIPLLSEYQDKYQSENDTYIQYAIYDNFVLQFFGYYNENELHQNKQRKRFLIIYLYLSDDTIEIIEEKLLHTGKNNYNFLIKDKIYKQDGTYYDYKDFKIGQKILIYAKNIHIYACDQFTRGFYMKQNINQKENEAFPIPNVDQTLLEKQPTLDQQFMHKIINQKLDKQYQQQINQKPNLEKRQYLIFYVETQNITYQLKYHLKDDNIEINNDIQQFDKKKYVKYDNNKDIVNIFDFKQNGLINLDYNTFKILGTDQYTADFYKLNYGIHFEIYKNSDNTQYKQRSNFKVNEWRSQQNFYNTYGIINYNAILCNDQYKREFIIQLYKDNSLEIVEKKQKNSGRIQGIYLKRGNYIANQQIIEGQNIYINSQLFHIINQF